MCIRDSSKDREEVLLSEQGMAAKDVCEEYARISNWKLSTKENCTRVLFPILSNYTRRLLFSVGRTSDRNVEILVEDMIREYTCASKALLTQSSNVDALAPLVFQLPRMLLKDEWLGKSIRGPATPEIIGTFLEEYASVCTWRLTHLGNIQSLLIPRLLGFVQRVACCGVASPGAQRIIDSTVDAYQRQIVKMHSHVWNVQHKLPALLQETYWELIREELPATQVAGFCVDHFSLEKISAQISAATCPAECKEALRPLLGLRIPVVRLDHESWGSVVDGVQAERDLGREPLIVVRLVLQKDSVVPDEFQLEQQEGLSLSLIHI
eukprot:TRINITY_DN46252_c0_g2_i1.p1 TRINITY_DN46252_c0_g2~~TRINITY_DN46252_c0_g2_i1.p1  ORF type:complete len:361 (+),score=62.97 TRINITY_DN46252_c0_g2_i1:116-1084(+)